MILDHRARLEAPRAKDIEREVDRERRAVEEQSPAPELLGEGEAPLGIAEVGLERADLEEADDFVGSTQRDTKGDVLTSRTLPVRPLDEALESLDARRRRRQELRDGAGRHRGEERWSVRDPQFAQRDARAGQRRQASAPMVGADVHRLQRQRQDRGVVLRLRRPIHLSQPYGAEPRREYGTENGRRERSKKNGAPQPSKAVATARRTNTTSSVSRSIQS